MGETAAGEQVMEEVVVSDESLAGAATGNENSAGAAADKWSLAEAAAGEEASSSTLRTDLSGELADEASTLSGEQRHQHSGECWTLLP